jgi:hypothetical protein
VRKGAAILVVGLWLVWSRPAASEVLTGLTTGVVVSGQQNLVFKEYPSDGGRPNRIFTPNHVTESLGPLVGATITAWGDWPTLRYFGAQFDPIYWAMSAKGANSPPAPHFTVQQQRAALYLSPLGRLPLWPFLGRFSEEPGKDTFGYLGAGVGGVHSSVTHGASAWGRGYQLLGGVSIPLTGHLRLRLESRYLLGRDVDTTPRDGPGWRVNTSGTHVQFTVNRHLDTRFHPVLLGVDWRF